MKFSIKDLGCKVNAYEAAWYQQQLEQLGWQMVEFGQPADVCLINSCTVTNTAGAKSRQMLHAARQANPQAVIAIVGCYVQMEAGQPSVFEDADIVLGSRDKTKLPDLLVKAVADRQKVWLVNELQDCPFETMIVSHFSHTRAYLKIQDGCQQFCSYCVIPYARGPQRCLDFDTAVSTGRQLTANGYQEIVLAGIHTGRYNSAGHNLAFLMKELLKDSRLKRLRLSSIEMTEITDELLDLMVSDSRVACHLHIPLQSGSDAILKAMNRPYDTAWYADRLQKIRDRIPLISVSTDVIAGFPGESDVLFQQTYEFVKHCHFSFLHVFPYAAKKHTPASIMDAQVDPRLKKKRASDLTALSSGLYNEYASRLCGRTVQVLFETCKEGILRGHCSEYLTVAVSGDESLVHKMGTVRVTGISGKDLTGCLIQQVGEE